MSDSVPLSSNKESYDTEIIKCQKQKEKEKDKSQPIVQPTRPTGRLNFNVKNINRKKIKIKWKSNPKNNWKNYSLKNENSPKDYHVKKERNKPLIYSPVNNVSAEDKEEYQINSPENRLKQALLKRKINNFSKSKPSISTNQTNYNNIEGSPLIPIQKK